MVTMIKRRVARKDYRCDGCRQPITAGSTYWLWSHAPHSELGNDHWSTFRSCSDNSAICRARELDAAFPLHPSP